MNCVHCGAPLPAKTIRCPYCDALNDVDLRTMQQNLGKEAASDRKCPRCDMLMKSVDLGIDGTFYIERCDRCLGLFFDPGELEHVLDVSTQPPDQADRELLNAMVEEGHINQGRPVKYVKCPVCHELMNRKVYGAKSGVIVDICRDHGVWLDGGELAQLVKWANAGGLKLDAETRQRDAESEARRKRFDHTLEDKLDTERLGGASMRNDDLLTIALRGLFGW